MSNGIKEGDFYKELVAVRRKLAKAMLNYEAFMEREGLEVNLEDDIAQVCRCREEAAKKR